MPLILVIRFPATNTATAGIESVTYGFMNFLPSFFHSCLRILAAFLGLTAVFQATAIPALPEWTPIFKGIDHLVATNLPDRANYPNLQVGNALRINLTDPDIKLVTTPRIANYQQNFRETGGMTVSRFLQTQHVQAAINANFFSPSEYYLPEGTPMALDGLAISQGVIVSPQQNSLNSSAVVFDITNRASIIHTNWPATSNAGRYTAVSGDYPLVVNGINISRKYLTLGGFVHGVNPRTAIGLSQDGKYLFLLTIDGRQSGYSDGAYDYETAGWLLLLGAYDGVNMDGGGSSTMVVADAAGNPRELNSPSSVADSGKERTVASHFGILAKPVPGFITQVVALPDDDAATLTWTTPIPANAQVEYGPTESLGSASALQTGLGTNHAVLLTNLAPGTGYYYQAHSTANGALHTSPLFFFTTYNYVTTNAVLALTDSWKYTSANLDGINWTAPTYKDSTWSGPGPGLLWVDTRGTGPNPSVQPKGTQMPANGATGYPFNTYHFRTHFSLPSNSPGPMLTFSGLIDDGAILYLNGHEIFRLRMDESPTAIANSTLASGFPCAGDATCLDEFLITGTAAGFLATGDNVLCAEVHNYNSRSADITFGLEVGITQPNPTSPRLDIARPDGRITLSWTRGGFTLQQSASTAGPWNDVAGPVISSPFTPTESDQTLFYRLRK